jgi:flagellar biosynthesis/type III secretory pathway chaperone
MSVIPIQNNKDVEKTNLETHVILSLERNAGLLERIQNLEKKISDVVEQSRANKRILHGAIITVITGVISTVFSLITHIPK